MQMHAPDIERPEERWSAIVAAFAAVALHFALPPSLRMGPPWILAGTVAALVLAAVVTRKLGAYALNNAIGFTVLGVLALGLIWGVVSLLLAIVGGHAKALDLLRSAAALWATNVVVFATVYWRLDAGGPNERERLNSHTRGAFLFPQMTLRAPSGADATMADDENWRPHYLDYFFVAFNTSTAFSPTDVPVLSKWAKVAMMVQAIISFTAVVLIAARAVNIL